MDFEWWCLLVYAETRGKAKAAFLSEFYDQCDDYLTLRAWRQKDYDKFYTGQKFVMENNDLPEGAPPFYDVEAIL